MYASVVSVLQSSQEALLEWGVCGKDKNSSVTKGLLIEEYTKRVEKSEKQESDNAL